MGFNLHCLLLLKPYFQRAVYIHNFTIHSTLLNHYSNRQTVNLMAAVGLMCRLLSDSVSSLLLSLTPKLYPALYFIMVKLNQWWWWDVNLIMHSKPHIQGLHLRPLKNCTTTTNKLFHLQFSLFQKDNNCGFHFQLFSLYLTGNMCNNVLGIVSQYYCMTWLW